MPIAPKGPEDNNQKPLSRRPWIGTALIYIVVIAIVTFMIFFLVRPSYSSKNTKTFTNADIRQVVDEDGNISYEGDSGGKILHCGLKIIPGDHLILNNIKFMESITK